MLKNFKISFKEIWTKVSIISVASSHCNSKVSPVEPAHYTSGVLDGYSLTLNY